MIALCLLAAAVALVFWPLVPTRTSPAVYVPSPVELAPPKPPQPTYQQAISDLARVRLRLLQADALDDKVKAAIDTLTLALVAGSDT